MLTATLPQRPDGFSLLELMVALAIIGLFLTLAMPAVTTWVMNTRIRSTAESLSSGLQLARNEAVRRNAAVEFVLDPVGSGWQVRCKAVTPACPNTDPIQQRASAEGSASDITITPAGGLTAEFSGLGMLTLPGGGVNLDIDGPIASESRELRVTVGAGGNVRLCDPQTTAPDPRAC